MKKLLIATAALAMVAGTAQAQSSVTVYGIVDTGYNSLENKTSGDEASSSKTNAVSTNGEASTSRIGFRGTEDLGGGMKANFVVESTIGQAGMATATVFGSRAFWAGLEDAKLGQVRVGRQNTFNRDVWLAHDQLAFANVAGNLAHSSALGDAGTSSHLDFNQAVNYLSPRFNGVQFSLGMTQNDNTTTGEAKTKTGSGSQVSLNYAAGKFAAGVAYSEATTSTKDEEGAQDSSLKTKDTSAAASYDFGVAKVAYIYNKRDRAQGVAVADSEGAVDRTSHAFSASFPLTPKLVGRLGYGMGEYRAGAADAYKGDIKGYQAALNYNLSKRTTVYGIYGNEKRDTAAGADIETKEYSVGVRHSF